MKRGRKQFQLTARIILTGLAGSASGQACDDTSLFSTPFPAAFGRFGHSLATSGSTLMVGEPAARLPWTNPKGAVHFYERGVGNQFTSTFGFVGIDLPDYSQLGTSVTISGDYAAAGLPGYSVPGYPNLGLVAIFHRVNGAWGIESYVFNPLNEPNQSFGMDVALHQNFLVVGATGYNSGQGVAYMFERIGASWILRSTFAPSLSRTANSLFGASVAINSNWVAVGAPDNNSPWGEPQVGAVHLYRRSGSTATWNGFFTGGTTNHRFGADIVASESLLLIGVPGDRRVSIWSAGSENINLRLVLFAPPDSPTMNFNGMGFSVAITPDERHVLMTSPSSSPRMVLDYDISDGSVVYRGAHLPSPDDDGNMSLGIAAFNDQAVLGAEFSSANGYAWSGAVRVRPHLRGSRQFNCWPEPIGVGETVRSCSSGAASTGIADACGGSSASPENWFVFDPPCPGIYVAYTSGATFTTTLSAYRGTCQSQDLIACTSQTPGWGTDAALQLDTTQGPVVLRVAGANGSSGAYSLVVAPASQPNDVCTDAQPLEPGDYTVCNRNAQDEGPSDVYCSPRQRPSRDLWYTFTPACSGTATIHTDSNTFDTVLAVYSGSCETGLTLMTCNDDSYPYGTGSMVQFPATAGQTFTLRLGGYYADQAGSTRLVIDVARGCAADFNFDGGVDGADVDDFFSQWEGGRPCADVNEDGGVDGADIDWFFSVWETGGC